MVKPPFLLRPADAPHEVMDADWRVTDLTAGLKDRAWAQSIARALGVAVRLDLENHHNFAWGTTGRLSSGGD